MAKYRFKFKKRIVQEYLSGNGNYGYLANKPNLPSAKEDWDGG